MEYFIFLFPDFRNWQIFEFKCQKIDFEFGDRSSSSCHAFFLSAPLKVSLPKVDRGQGVLLLWDQGVGYRKLRKTLCTKCVDN
jgi:hypothetical protein